MNKIDLNGKEVLVYSSIKEMPMTVYNRMQGLLIQESGIGSDIGSVMSHFERLDAFIAAGKLSDAATERQNLHFNLYTMLEGISFPSMALACSIYSVDGLQVHDYSDEGLDRLVKTISELGFTNGHMEDVLEELRKKWIPN